MDNAFVPLLPRSRSALSASPRTVSAGAPVGGDAPPGFQPAILPPDPGDVSAKAKKSSVTVRRENGVVTAIHVQCACGQTIELHCDYDSAVPRSELGCDRKNSPSGTESFAAGERKQC